MAAMAGGKEMKAWSGCGYEEVVLLRPHWTRNEVSSNSCLGDVAEQV